MRGKRYERDACGIFNENESDAGDLLAAAASFGGADGFSGCVYYSGFF